MKTKSEAPAEANHSEPTSPAPSVRRNGRLQLRVKTNIRAGRESTKHPAKVTVPDIKLG